MKLHVGLRLQTNLFSVIFWAFNNPYSTSCQINEPTSLTRFQGVSFNATSSVFECEHASDGTELMSQTSYITTFAIAEYRAVQLSLQ